ncbi:hypothetical protein [Kitasatospora sp. NPDC087314]|uniref:hypothetical protein n=1 Tax=Kitasatospora sp. NPDC087314 TaxID=3364068 RepID=UPI003821E8A5
MTEAFLGRVGHSDDFLLARLRTLSKIRVGCTWFGRYGPSLKDLGPAWSAVVHDRCRHGVC